MNQKDDSLYKEMNLKDKLKEMTEEEQLQLLATNGMLVKRPLVVGEDFVLTGFKESAWNEVATQLIGSYNLDNALCAAAVGRYFGVSAADVSAALAELESRVTALEENDAAMNEAIDMLLSGVTSDE